MAAVARITDWIDEWSALWSAGELPQHVQIAPGPRLRRSLGRCQPQTGLVRIHPALFETPHTALFREVVCHEVAHVAVHLLYEGKPRPHGPEWKRLMTAAGYEPRARMDPRRLPETLRKRFQSAPVRRRRRRGFLLEALSRCL